MINLLPTFEKEELKREEELKLILILGFLFLAFLISLTLILVLIKIHLSQELEIQKIFLKEAENRLSLESELEKEIRDFNFLLSQLNSFYQKRLEMSKILEKISSTLPERIYLTNLNFILSPEGDIATISLSGFSPTRELLLSFKEKLEREEGFFEIFFPPENWIRSTDINFSCNFKLKNDHKK